MRKFYSDEQGLYFDIIIKYHNHIVIYFTLTTPKHSDSDIWLYVYNSNDDIITNKSCLFSSNKSKSTDPLEAYHDIFNKLIDIRSWGILNNKELCFKETNIIHQNADIPSHERIYGSWKDFKKLLKQGE